MSRTDLSQVKKLGSIRGAAGQWTMAVRRNDAERYLAERHATGAP
jgi:hypothetical protein